MPYQPNPKKILLSQLVNGKDGAVKWSTSERENEQCVKELAILDLTPSLHAQTACSAASPATAGFCPVEVCNVRVKNPGPKNTALSCPHRGLTGHDPRGKEARSQNVNGTRHTVYGSGQQLFLPSSLFREPCTLDLEPNVFCLLATDYFPRWFTGNPANGGIDLTQRASPDVS